MRSLLACLLFAAPPAAAEPPKPADIFAMKNLVAWCIVPFDSQKRTPKQRAEMLQRLGFTQYAYDWRAEHLPSFPEEIELLKKAKISLKGVWFPASVGKDGEFILEALKKADVNTELWVMLPQPKAEAQDDKVKETAALVKGLAQRAAKQGCKVGIYNHGGWTGEPANMVAVAKACGEPNVGIVYNMHHGHSHLPKLDEYLKIMRPHLYCVNLNGMDPDGEKTKKKIEILGTRIEDFWTLGKIANAQLGCPYGILGHTNDDAEERLQDNLDGISQSFGRKKPLCSEDSHFARLPRTTPEFTTLRLVSGSIEVNKISIVPAKKSGIDFATANRGTLTGSIRVFKEDPELCLAEILDSTQVVGSVKWLPEKLGPGLQQGKLVFTPRFPFEPGMTYRVFVLGLPNSWYTAFYGTFTIPKTTQEKPTTVEAVFPTSAKLPENALRMYLHFSAPMKQGFGQKYLRLECDGKVVVEPYLHVEQELWSADGKRLTILFDPARVKRGLRPREEAGPILVEGKRHTLTIDPAWPDALGFPLKEKFAYSFDVGPPDDQPIDPAKWKIAPPANSSPLTVAFEKPLDKALSERLIWVVDADGKRLELPSTAHKDQTGINIGDSKTVWKPGKYKLVIDTRLEDVCGNRVGEAFEVDEFKPVTQVVAGKTVEREFTVR
jgi:hypothetical protein